MFLAALLTLALQDPDPLRDPPAVPWTEISAPTTGARDRLREVGLCVASDGSIVSSSCWSDSLGTAELRLARSTDTGRTWKSVATFEHTSGASLFSHGDRVWTFGVDGRDSNRGCLALRCSSDGGVTWTDPVDEHSGRVRGSSEFQARAGPVIVHGNRIYKLIGVSAPTLKGTAPTPAELRRTHVFVASADLDSNWLEESSWRFSTELPLDDVGASFDRNEAVLVQPVPSRLAVIVRGRDRKNRPLNVAAAVVDDGRTLVKSPADAALSLPLNGCGMSLPVDPVSWRHIALVAESTSLPSESPAFDWCNRLNLYSSQNVKQWQLRSTLLLDQSAERFLFSDAAWVLQEDDLIAAVCMTRPAGGTATRGSWTARVVFLRVPSYRSRTEETPPMWETPGRK